MNVMRKKVTLLFLAACVAIVLISGCEPTLSRTISATGSDVLKNATRVEVFRVSPRDTTDPKVNAIGHYPILSTGKEQGQAFAARLADILLGGGVTQNQKKCGLQPGVAYRLWKDKQAVEVLVCFKCDVLWAHVVGETGEQPSSEYKDFDSVRAKLLALTKEAFPDDKEIQDLPEVRKKD
jgi:hypothetical protein